MRLGTLLCAALLLTGCSATAPPAPAGPTAPEGGRSGPAVAELLAGTTQRTPKELPVERLADGLTPPTNRWYSGLVFGEQAQPVFPLPLGFALTPDGFGFGLPRVSAGADTIAGGYTADVTVGVGARRSVVSSDDPSVVVLDNLGGDGRPVGRTTIAQGSPFVSWVAAEPTTVELPEGFRAAGDGLWVADLGGTSYAMAADRAEVQAGSARVAENGSLVFWAVPEGADPAQLKPFAAVLRGSEVSHTASGEEVHTTLTYTGAGDTAIARLPHQGGADCGLGAYPSIYGQLTVCPGGELTWATPRTPAVGTLDLSGLSGAQRERLTSQLAEDLAGLPDFPADSYFGGKTLQRTAMLLGVADQLGLRDEADRLAGTLDEQLARWTEPRGCEERPASCFVYDPEGRGMIGLTPSFGSEEYNDHHFHYGYFLYAAGVLAAHDPGTAARYAPVMNLLAADIGSTGSDHFPDRRHFDAWAGHSWASGTSPFADGNNQESVSEAVNAYAGLNLWAQATGDQRLAADAEWMLSLEADSSRRYWLEPDLAGFGEYRHGISVLNWGGKRDYATWFSAEPAAKLGILLLPMSPTSTYLAGDPDRIRRNVREAVGDRFDQKFGDYILMYAALAGPEDRERAVTAAEKLPREVIDDGMSRTYLLAWLYSRQF